MAKKKRRRMESDSIKVAKRKPGYLLACKIDADEDILAMSFDVDSVADHRGENEGE